jgi:predicted Zn finger-like uncharacterized protein
MLIVCPSCATSYNVGTASLGTAGRSVRCVACRNTWFALPTDLAQDVSLRRVSDAVAAAEASAERGAGRHLENMPSASEWAAVDTVAADARPQPSADTGIDEMSALDTQIVPADTDLVLEPKLIGDAPPLAPAGPGGVMPQPGSDGPAPNNIEFLAAQRARRNRGRHRKLALPIALLALVAANTALLAWRKDVVRYLPQTASLYDAIGLPVNLRGLTFAQVATSKESHEGVTVLAVEGTLANASARPVEVPRLRFAVRNEAGNEIYSWTALPSRQTLGPGETLPFRSRLASPPGEMRDVLVRFFTRRDLAAGNPN